ncbi:MAG: hypothetical protein GXP55_26475 [Deltaproteobacteria bacterium]|nr:hypothetical protein [Deltaproteobacteria bacterium]
MPFEIQGPFGFEDLLAVSDGRALLGFVFVGVLTKTMKIALDSGPVHASAAKFYAVGSFLMRSRNLFVVIGDVLEGTVVAGMRLRMPLGGTSVGVRVASVEYVDVVHEGKGYVGLAMEYADPADLELLMALHVGGETLGLEAE